MLFPADPLQARRADDHFAEEAAAARRLGHDVALVDLERLAEGDTAGAVARVRNTGEDVVYRGWMLPAARYAALATALGERAVVLRVDPGQYRRGHELPGWYEAFEPLTPESHWTNGDDRDDFDRARRLLESGAAVVRDWVKSAKHEWATATYVPDVADADAAWAVASRLREIRDDEFTGGFVLRRFEEFVGPEARTWWRGGRCVAVTAHPDTPGEVPDGVDTATLDLLVGPAVRATALPFVTVDLVRDAGDRWRVVELGDGQVSDRPGSTDADEFVAAVTPLPA